MRNYINEISKLIDEGPPSWQGELSEAIEKLGQSKYLCLFGAGIFGISTMQRLNSIGVKVDFFCDNNSSVWGSVISSGIRCIPPTELVKYKSDISVVITATKAEAISRQLRDISISRIYGIDSLKIDGWSYFRSAGPHSLKSNILNLLEIVHDSRSRDIIFNIVAAKVKHKCLCDSYGQFLGLFGSINSPQQYFTDEIFNLSDSEVFVDAGAFDGDTLQEFLKIKGNRFSKIIAFEPEKENYLKLESFVENQPVEIRNKISLHNAGISDVGGVSVISFESVNASFEKDPIGSAPSREVRLVSLDSHIGEEKVTFIKMDIEGSELKALRGASSIIRKHRPKLAICVYHRMEHLWEIPMYIKSLVPEYRIHIRHHSPQEFETVCYANI
ncbi:MAG: FkbM family methyltransferase [Oligoflexales bacterium]|nr:FkbM family methyltransferase [Oligoflexales bacterium]